jgi:tRNA dimethylallyltransferase
MIGEADRLIVVVGPTAAGKSSLAIELAERLGGEVVSADSQQVYRGFDIGTAKPTLEERRGVPHHLIDVVEPGVPFSAARFVELAEAALAEIAARGRRAVVAGGTGLYVRALLHGLFEAPPASPEVRGRHGRRWAADPAGLYAELEVADPEAAARIHPRDFVRISRALEVREQTGLTITALQQRHAFAEARHPARVLGISPPRPALRGRIEARVEAMMAAGWLDEVRSLCAAGHGETRPMGALGYRHLRLHLQQPEQLPLEEAVRQIERDTWRFARRQLNWFSSDPEVRWHQDRTELTVDALG